MKKMIGFLVLGMIPFMIHSTIDSASTKNRVEKCLEPYREYLEMGTYSGMDQTSMQALPKSRYDTFKAAFNHIQHEGAIVVELGTSRSFTHGGHPGCNLDDISFWTPEHPENWDWGAGFFTRMAATCLNQMHPKMYTVDISAQHINRCKVMTGDFKEMISYHVSSSEEFLSKCNFPQGIDLLYLDTGDMTPIEPTALLQYREAQIIVQRDLIAKNGLILIDDVRNPTPKLFGETSDLGKSKYSLPYLLKHGFEIVMNEYQVLLRKK